MKAGATLLLGALLLPSAANATAGRWQTYANVRYGFAICYPADLLEPKGEADNGDGQTFRAADGAELRAFGSNNALDRTLADEAREQARHYTGKRGRITYRAAKPGWQVLSGNDGASTLFYAKTIARDGQFFTFQLKYPKSASVRYKPVVEQLARCFRPTEQGR